MRYVSRCAANRWVFNVHLKLSMLSVGSRREFGKRVPDHRSCNGERSASELAATMSWHDQLTPIGWPQALTTGNVRRKHTAVHQVLGSTILEAPINCDSELMPMRASDRPGLGYTSILPIIFRPCRPIVHRLDMPITASVRDLVHISSRMRTHDTVFFPCKVCYHHRYQQPADLQNQTNQKNKRLL